VPAKREPDGKLLEALTKAYSARAQLFHSGVVASKIDLLITEIDGIPARSIKWDLKHLGVTTSAFNRVKRIGILPHQVFPHPAVLMERPHLIAYYRNIATISQKGIGQILFSTADYEKKSRQMTQADADCLCKTLNRIISAVIDTIPSYSVSLSRNTIYAEIGAQLQGTWANVVGQKASKQVANLLDEYITAEGIGRRTGPRTLKLSNGWLIVFGTEPDVAFFDEKKTIQIAIEIKGSLDVAGAQTRYGEAKKSFAKQVASNPRCHTIYLASCFTDAVIRQIKADGQVRDWFNLTSILYDAAERKHFLQRLFYIVRTPTR
jgi:hypothetical protein